MDFKEYQDLAQRTAGDFKEEERPFWTLVSACGLSGEAGEVTDYLKKVYGHNHSIDINKLEKELGDVLWYAADLASKHGLSLENIAIKNIDKLKARYPEGFSVEKSKNRKINDD